MATKETESQRQVKQMVNFIMQEANEKVNEIRIKVSYKYYDNLESTFILESTFQTDHDFNLEKQQLIHNGKLKVQEEYSRKQKELEVQERV